jgi:hypothetical protein
MGVSFNNAYEYSVRTVMILSTADFYDGLVEP